MAIQSPEQAGASAAVAIRSSLPTASGHWTQAWRRLRRDRAAMLGAAVVVLLVLVAVFADVLAPYDYAAQNMSNRYAPPGEL